MPFIYSSQTKQVPLENFTTSGSGNTEIDFFFLKPGASRPLAMIYFKVQGKGGGLTALSGMSIRQKFWATAAAGGTATTPTPKNNLAPACVATCGQATTAGGTVTIGTTATYGGYASMGASGPGGWVAINPDDAIVLDGNSGKSSDLISSCPTASLNFETEVGNQEG